MSLIINNTSQALTNGASQQPCEVNQQLLSGMEREMGHKKVKRLDREDTASLWQSAAPVMPRSMLVTTNPFPPDFLSAVTDCKGMATDNAFGY